MPRSSPDDARCDARVTGFEPATEIPVNPAAVNDYENSTTPGAALALQTSGTNCHCVSSFDAVLQRVIKVWAFMPDETRREVLAILDAASPSRL